MSKTLLVTQKGCGGCEGVKNALADVIASGEVTEVSITSDKGEKIADQLGLDWVPECVTDNEDGTYTKCSLEKLLDEKGKK
jgi:hypothetical protein